MLIAVIVTDEPDLNAIDQQDVPLAVESTETNHFVMEQLEILNHQLLVGKEREGRIILHWTSENQTNL